MILQNFTQVELVRGFLSFIFVVISFIIGTKISLNYFHYKVKQYLTLGLSWIFLSASWWWPTFNFIFLLFFNLGLDNFTYLILANVFIPIAILCWIYSFSTLVYPHFKTQIMIAFSVICIPYEILLIIFLIINPELVGVEISPNIIQRTPLTFYFAIFAIVIAFTTGIIFAKKSMNSEDPKIRWKGRFLLIAFIFFTFGAAMDSFSWENLILVFIIRLLLILSSINYYLGFFLPDSFADRLIKE
ncbi:MAG: hypothetical protein GF383_01605 [Candidatus Lokiarchaeota archaeon]|nr:hypothetical protein [Candidatus Lokiarchaeota archaeon]MBD3337992.1 hypothetical protein [Candidatus Lokiarchaeota archaeon]